ADHGGVRRRRPRRPGEGREAVPGVPQGGGEGREDRLVSRDRPLLHGGGAPRLRGRRSQGRLDPDARLAGGEARAATAGETRAGRPGGARADSPAHAPLTDAGATLEAARDLSEPTPRARLRDLIRG